MIGPTFGRGRERERERERERDRGRERDRERKLERVTRYHQVQKPTCFATNMPEVALAFTNKVFRPSNYRCHRGHWYHTTWSGF